MHEKFVANSFTKGGTRAIYSVAVGEQHEEQHFSPWGVTAPLLLLPDM